MNEDEVTYGGTKMNDEGLEVTELNFPQLYDNETGEKIFPMASDTIDKCIKRYGDWCYIETATEVITADNRYKAELEQKVRDKIIDYHDLRDRPYAFEFIEYHPTFTCHWFGVHEMTREDKQENWEALRINIGEEKLRALIDDILDDRLMRVPRNKLKDIKIFFKDDGKYAVHKRMKDDY